MDINVVAVGADGFVDLRNDLAAESNGTALGYHKAWWLGIRLYHKDGCVYEVKTVEPSRFLGALSKVLAFTVYNPVLSFKYQYRTAGPYSLTEFRGAITNALKQDDDILTQFCERDELQKLLAEAADFDSIVAAIYRGMHEDLSDREHR